jgi:hypothetical protein
MLRNNFQNNTKIAKPNALQVYNSFKKIKLCFGLYIAFYFHLRILIAKEIYRRLIEQKYIIE